MKVGAVSMARDIDRRTVLAATGAGMAIGLTGIASAEERGRGRSRRTTEVVSVGLTHRIDAATDDLEVWTVDDVPAYRVRGDRGEVAVRGHPERDVAGAFRRSAAVVDLRGHPRATALGTDDLPAAARAAAGGSASSIVTELGPQARVLERIPVVGGYEPPRIDVRSADGAVAVDADGGAERFEVAPGEGRRRRLATRTVPLRTLDGDATDVAVTPVVRARHHGALEIVEEPPGAGGEAAVGGR